MSTGVGAVPAGTTSAYACRLAVREVEARGLDPDPVLRRARVPRAEIEDPTARIPTERGLACLRLLARLADDPDLGLAAGRLARITDFEVAGLALRGCRDLAGACAFFDRHAAAWGPRQVRIGLTTEHLSIRLVDAAPAPRILADCHLAAVMACWAAVAGPTVPDRVSFRHGRPRDVSAYTRLFGVDPRFAAEESAIRFPTHPRRPMPHADRLVVEVVEPLVAARSAAAGEPDGVEDMTARVRSAVWRHLPTGDVSVEAVARDLALSERSLRRRLAAEGTRFSQLLDEVRREQVLAMVGEERWSAGAIAARVGYSDPATVYRAVLRWTGSPMRLRP